MKLREGDEDFYSNHSKKSEDFLNEEREAQLHQKNRTVDPRLEGTYSELISTFLLLYQILMSIMKKSYFLDLSQRLNVWSISFVEKKKWISIMYDMIIFIAVLIFS